MSNTNNSAPSKKSGAGKTFLSVLFYILILASAFVLAVCMNVRTKSGTVLSAYAEPLSEDIVKFAAGDVCFWLAFSAVILWFGLWIVTTKRVASAIRGLGIACTIAPLSVLLGELITMLLVCVFKLENGLTPYADSLPSQFADGCGDNVIFLLTSLMIASFGVFLCKVKNLPKKTKAVPIQQASEAPAPVTAPAASVSASESNITDIDVDVSGAPSEPSESLVASLAGVCHICGKKNAPDVKFCGGCGAKLM